MKRNKNIQPRSIETLYLELYERLVNERKSFPDAGPIKESVNQGVYVILKNGTQVLHVGRTTRNAKGLLGRLQAHLRGRSSFVKSYFNGDGSQLRKRDYSYAVLEVADPYKRDYLEALAIGKLCPKHIGTGANSILKE